MATGREDIANDMLDKTLTLFAEAREHFQTEANTIALAIVNFCKADTKGLLTVGDVKTKLEGVVADSPWVRDETLSRLVLAISPDSVARYAMDGNYSVEVGSGSLPWGDIAFDVLSMKVHYTLRFTHNMDVKRPETYPASAKL